MGAQLAQFKLQENITKYLKYMELVKSASPHTLRSYQLDLNQAFSEEISHNQHKIRSSITESEMLALARASFSGPWAKLSLATRNRKAATLKSFFSWAFDQELISEDLSVHIICPKVPKKIPHFLSVDEALAVLGSFESTEFNNAELKQKNKVLFLLLYGGGLRISEACNLRWSQVNLNDRSLRILGKGNKERIMVLPKMCIQEMQVLKHMQTRNEFVFGIEPLNTRTAYEMIRQSGKHAGLLHNLHPHALRHSFATHLLSSGANLRTLQEMLGHESLQATEKYTHLGIDQLARTMEAMHPLGQKKNKISA